MYIVIQIHVLDVSSLIRVDCVRTVMYVCLIYKLYEGPHICIPRSCHRDSCTVLAIDSTHISSVSSESTWILG